MLVEHEILVVSCEVLGAGQSTQLPQTDECRAEDIEATRQRRIAKQSLAS